MKNEPKNLADLFSNLKGERVKGSVDFIIEPTDDELLTILKTVALANKSEFTKAVMDFYAGKYGIPPTKVSSMPDLSRVSVHVKGEIDTGAKPVAGKVRQAVQRTETKGSSHVWKGFYEAVGAILDEQRGRGRTFISYDDLLAELHDFTDEKGNKMFEKNGELLPMKILRHRMAPSQVVRQAKGQPNLRGVENDKKNKGLKFY